MKITSSHNQYSPAFKQINLVQVSKKAFPNPENLNECTSMFFQTISKHIKTPSTKMRDIISTLGLNKYFLKYDILPESPSVMFGLDLTKRYKYCLEWFEQNTGIKFRRPIDKDRHSFFVFTKEHHQKSCDIVSYGNIGSIQRKVIAQYNELVANGQKPSDFYMHALQAQSFDKQMDELIQSAEVHKFQIEDLSKVDEIIKHMDF